MLGHVLILGSQGGFGRLFTRLFEAEGVGITGLDRAAHPAADPDTALDVALDAALAALPPAGVQAVVLCIPESEVVHTVPRLVQKSPLTGALFIDICSVKSKVVRAFGGDVHHLSLHPMFAPSAGFDQQNVCYIDSKINQSAPADPSSPDPSSADARIAHMLDLLRRWGANLVRLESFEQHDRLTAYGQAAAHAAAVAFGLTLARADVDAAQLAAVSTPVHRLLAEAAARIAAGDPSVYRTIQHANPHAAAARQALAATLAELDAAAAAPDPAAFERLLRHLRESPGQ